MPFFFKIALVIWAVAGGVWDFRFRRIPNSLNLSGVILGLALNALVYSFGGLKLSVLGMALAFLIYLPLYAVRGMGAGDVKLMVALGAIVGPKMWFQIFLITAILGGIASMALILARGRLFVTFANLSTIATELLHARMPFTKDPSLDIHDKRAIGLPHGSIIAVAALASLLF